MRHRIGGGITGLGNPIKELLSNTGELTPAAKEMADEAIKLYFKKWGGCDYETGENSVKLGIEPAHQFEDLKIICITRNKEKSFLHTGRAFGGYGSGIRSTIRFYSDYKKGASSKNSWTGGIPEFFS